MRDLLNERWQQHVVCAQRRQSNKPRRVVLVHIQSWADTQERYRVCQARCAVIWCKAKLVWDQAAWHFSEFIFQWHLTNIRSIYALCATDVFRILFDSRALVSIFLTSFKSIKPSPRASSIKHNINFLRGYTKYHDPNVLVIVDVL